MIYDLAYGEDRLGQYARDIGVPVKTLMTYRTVFRAWQESSTRVENWSVCRELASQSDRHELVKLNPEMTVSMARAIVRERSTLPAPQNNATNNEIQT